MVAHKSIKNIAYLGQELIEKKEELMNRANKIFNVHERKLLLYAFITLDFLLFSEGNQGKIKRTIQIASVIKRILRLYAHQEHELYRRFKIQEEYLKELKNI